MDFEIAADAKQMSRALFQITHGLYILTAKSGNKLNGQCLDACMQVTNTPPRLAIGVGKRSLTHEMIMATGRFVVNAIDSDDGARMEKVKHFGFQSGRTVDKFATMPFIPSGHGLPILPDAKAYYECAVISEFTQDLGTHTLFVGTVDGAGVHEGGQPFTYNEYRKSIKRGG